MELVYLWVEDYKNIKQQGFNFSPRFECKFFDKYNNNEELKDNCKLKIKRKKESLSIFPKNIDVTAIVGENGGGKTSLMKLIFLLIYYKKHSSDNENDYIKLINQKYKKSIFLIIYDDGKYYKITLNKNINSNTTCDELENLNFFSVYFNYISDSWYNDFEDDWVNQIYHKNDNYKTPILLQPNKQDSNTLSNSINLDMISYLNSQRILQFYSTISNSISISNFFKPSRIKIQSNSHSFSYSSDGNFVIIKKVNKIASQILEPNKKYKYKYNHSSNNKMYRELKELEDSNNFKYLNQLYITFKVLLSNKSSINNIVFTRIENAYKKMINDDTLMPEVSTIQKEEFSTLINHDASEYEVLKIKKCIEFQNENMHKNAVFKKLFDEKYLKIEDNKVKNLLSYIPAWLNIDFYEEDKALHTLSSGEKALFTIITNIMYQFNNINAETYRTINIFLDETELGLHPNWQKKFLFDILESIKPLNINNKKINFILATHSPFIVSDIPKENIIFLEKGKQVHPEINSFGANIHTLLSDGFFMKKGLMGKFAKTKISKIIKKLNSKNYKAKKKKKIEILQIINSIGEDFLRIKLLNMYNNKFNTSKSNQLKRLNQEYILRKKNIEND